MLKLYAKTTTMRTTLSQEARIVMPADPGAPPGSMRKVQVLVPDGPVVYCGIDMPVQRAFSEAGVGPNRNYELPQLQPGQRTTMRLMPDQTITMSSSSGLAYVTLICEYLDYGS